MNIGIDCRELTGKPTGIGRSLTEFLKLASSRTVKHKIFLFGNQRTHFEQDFLNETTFQRILLPEKNTLIWDQVKLKRELKKQGVEVFFSPYYKIPLFSRTKLIISIFDVAYLLMEPDKNYFKNKYYLKKFIKFASTKAEVILTCSHHTKKDLLNILNLPEDKIKVVYLGISNRFKPADEDTIEQIKRKCGIVKNYLLYVGRFKSYKNLKRLIESYSLLPEALKRQYDLVLCGGESDCLTSALQSLPNEDIKSIITLNYISDADLPALYSGADLFVFPSLYEGFGLPPLEAMACGCPVASSNTSSMIEVLENSASFFDPYSVDEMSAVIRKMLEDERQRELFHQKGLERAELFTPENMTNQIFNILESVTGD